MLKRVSSFLILTLLGMLLYAVPVERVRQMVTLTTGEQVMVTSCGDEDLSFFTTDDGYVVELTDSGFVMTDHTVDEYLQQHENTRMNIRRRLGLKSTALINQSGVKHIPVILVSFKDKKMSCAADSAGVNKYFYGFCNGTMDGKPYTDHGSSSSIRDYFIQQSGGEFLPDFDVIGPVVLDSAYAYYGKDSGSSKDINYGKFVNEALTKAVASFSDWTRFDNDGNGSVDATVLIYAGMGQNYTNSWKDVNTIWPKEFASSYTVEGINFAGCFSTCEMHPTQASGGYITAWIPDGTGVFIHEMSHALGLPDFYDRKYQAFGMDYWDVMDYGQYASNSYAPVGYTAYERQFMGWQKLVTLTEPCTLTIPCFAKGGCGYKIVNPENTSEYYVLENRQAFGSDSVYCTTRGHGLLVIHVDYGSGYWTGNYVNNDSEHQRMTIIPANNLLIGSNNYSSYGGSSAWRESLQGNPYPGTSGNTVLDSESTPTDAVFTGGHMNQPLYDITENEDCTITLKFNPLGILNTPSQLACEDVTSNSALLTWDAVPEAQWYKVCLYADDELVSTTDSLADNKLQVSDLTAKTDYTFTVQAMADKYRNSETVRSIVYTTNEDAIANINESGSVVRLYTITGEFVKECYARDVNNFALNRGIYLMRTSNNKVRKILIK